MNEKSPVNIFNEWDPLEEVVVGVLDGLLIPPYEPVMEGCMYDDIKPMFRNQYGDSWPKEEIAEAEKDLNEFVHILEAEGCKVVRPKILDYKKPFGNPYWQSPCGLGAANPRDSLFVFGNDIIETPMGWRSRYFECFAYRELVMDYFSQGAGWISAPKGKLDDSMYVEDFQIPQDGEVSFVLKNEEPVFDAADMVKCGKDIFAGLSSTCNELGIGWLQSYLDGKYGKGEIKVHTLKFNDQHPMHIDATFYPLAPGKLLIHPDRVVKIPDMFRDWDVIKAPMPCIPKSHPLYFSSIWMNINVLMLDEKRVIVEKQEENMIRILKEHGFEVIPCRFRNFNSFGGSFHCATLDVRRKGNLQSYF